MTGEDSSKFPVPSITNSDRAFWEGVQEDKFLLQKCLDCSTLQFFPRPVCIHCFGSNLGWQQSEGAGTIYSFTPAYMPLNPAIRKHVEETGKPIIISIIELKEGIKVFSEIVGSKPEEVEIGAPVKVTFEEAKGTNFKLPKFRIMQSEA